MGPQSISRLLWEHRRLPRHRGFALNPRVATAPLGTKSQIEKIPKAPLFGVGRIAAAPGAVPTLERARQTAAEFVARHMTGLSRIEESKTNSRRDFDKRPK